mgnify:CR=1 FL=1
MHIAPALGHYPRRAAVYTGDDGPTRPTDVGALLAERDVAPGVVNNVTSGGASVADLGFGEPGFYTNPQLINTIGCQSPLAPRQKIL